jgi:hypothetical protein
MFSCLIVGSLPWHVTHHVDGVLPSAWHAAHPGPPVAVWAAEAFVP